MNSSYLHRFEGAAISSLAAFIWIAISGLLSAGDSLEDFLVPEHQLWGSPLAAFGESHAELGFRWLSEDREAVRSTSKKLRLLGEPVGETVIRADGKKIKSVDISLYSRGDHGKLSEALFTKRREAWEKRLQEHLKVSPEADADSKRSAVGLQRSLWYTPTTSVLLESNSEGGQPEFLRIRLVPKPSGAAYLTNSEGTNTRTRTKSELRRSVRRESNGDTFVSGVPMVDQGPKGYCVAASAERIFRYYGLEIDQHEMAQATKTSAKKGTDPKAMIGALEGMASRLQLRSRTLEDFDAKEFIKLVENYNREAKSQGAFDKQVVENFGRTIQIDGYFRQFDPGVLRDVRARGTAYTAFLGEIERQIDQGTPLLWGVRLGMFPEPEIPQASGGHMRVIIGYNDREKEILYTDSWGAGHEFKRMPADEAYTITTCVHLITPSR